MHTEHLRNLHPVWAAAGWLVAAAATSLAALALASFELVGGADTADDPVWAAITIAIGFGVGGLFTGFRAVNAPILHGIAIGLASLVAWLLVNLLTIPFPGLRWEALTPTLTAALLLLQMLSAVAGAWAGSRVALRGGSPTVG